MIGKLPNVEVFRDSEMTAADIVEFGADHVVLATGSHWRRDGVGVANMDPVGFQNVLTPDDVFAGAAITGPVVVYDDEHYFMGGALAEKLRLAGHDVTLITPHATVSSWTAMTDEQGFVATRLMQAGVSLGLSQIVMGQGNGSAQFRCAYTSRENERECQTLILITGRLPEDGLYRSLAKEPAPFSLSRVGDCLQPSSIADAVYSAHRFARGFGQSGADGPPRRERPPLKGRS